MEDGPKIKKRFIVWDVIAPVVMILIIMLISSFAVLIIGGLVTGIRDPELLIRAYPSISLWDNILFYGVSVIFFTLMRRKDEFRLGPHKLKWGWVKILCAVLIGTAISFLLNILMYLLHLHEIFPAYDEAAALSFSGQNVILLIAAIAVLGPIAEETVFRGLVFSRMRIYGGFALSALVSSLLFGLYHMNMVQFIYTACMGFVLAYIYEKSGSLIVPILTHAAMNLFALTTYF